MVPKQKRFFLITDWSFRAVLFRMVPKLTCGTIKEISSFRAVLFRMVPKLIVGLALLIKGFRAVLFRMVPKRIHRTSREP